MAGASKAILFCLAVGLMGIVVAALPFSLKIEENIGLNLLFWLRGPITPPEDVVVVAIGRNTARALNLPAEVDKWPRKIHARLVRRLSAAGAAVIAFDLMFDEPQSKENDAALAGAIEMAGNVLLAQVLIQDRLAIKDRDNQPAAYANIEKLVVPIPSLARAALAEAPFPLPKIPISLRQFWTFKASAGDIPTLPVVAFHVYARQAHDRLMQLAAQGRRVLEKEIQLPVSDRGEHFVDSRMQHANVVRRLIQKEPGLADRLLADMGPPSPGQPYDLISALIDLYRGSSSRYLNFYGPAGTIRTIPYHRVVASKGSPSGPVEGLDLTGKAVFVGLKEGAWGQVKDGFYTVYSQADGTDISGVEIAATAFANIAQRNSIHPPGLAGHICLILAWGIVMALIGLCFSIYFSAAASLGLSGLYLWGAVELFATNGVWLPIAVPLLLQMPVAYFCVLIRSHQRLTRERRNIRDAFGYYLPDAVVDKLSKNIDHVHEAGQVLYGICLFTDAQKYTTLSEAMSPVELTGLMNRYYETIFKPIKEYDGIILQVVGDSVLSIWASPRPDARLQAKACKAALAIGRAMQPARDEDPRADYQLPTRIGLHAGYILLGNIGAMDHFEYRPVGDIVNAASRLEGLNKHLGTWILASSDVLDSVNGLVTRDMGKFVFVGKSKPIQVRELALSAAASQKQQDAAHEYFVRGLSAFQSQSWTDARAYFSRSLTLIGQDGPSRFYLNMCDQYQHTPPSPGWDGSIALTQK